MIPLVFLAGAGVPAGGVLLVVALRGTPPRRRRDRRVTDLGRRATVAVVVGVVAGLVTRWPVVALLSTATAWTAPSLWGSKKALGRSKAITEAVAGWAELMRDTLAAGVGLEGAIVRSAPLAPDAIRPAVVDLATRLEGHESTVSALRAFALAVGDPTADLLVAALVEAAERPVRNLSRLLGALAASAREEAASQSKVITERENILGSVRLTMGLVLALAGGLLVFQRAYLAPYGTAFGQVMLAVIGGVFFGAFWLLAALSKMGGSERLVGSAR